MQDPPRALFLVLDPSGYHANPSAVPTALVAALLLVLALLVLLHERASRVSRLYAVLILPVTVWLLAFSCMYAAADEVVARWWAKAGYLGVPFLAPAMYHFTVVALQAYAPNRRLVWTAWGLAGCFSAVAVGSDALIVGMYRYWWGSYPRYGWLSAPFLVFFFGLMGESLHTFWVEYRAARPGTRRDKIKQFMVAQAVCYVATVDFLPKFGIAVYPFGWLPVFGWLTLAAVAIWRHQFVDITPAFAAQQITRIMADALLVVDRDGLVRVVNEAGCGLLGRPEPEVIGKSLAAFGSDLFPEHQMQAVMRTGAIRRYETTLPATGGRLLWLEVSASLIRDQANEPAAIVCVLRDVTARKEAEEALKTSEKRFRSVTQSANDAIVIADGGGRIVLWNRSAEAVFGYTEDEVRGMPLTMIMPERYQERHLRGLERFQRTGEAQVIGKTVELHGLRKNGAEFPVELSLATWTVGEERFFSGILRDVTERKLLEEQLRQSQKMEAVGRLAGGIAHDFNNILMVINGYGRLLLEQMDRSDPRRGDIEQILRSGQRATALTKQLLAFSRRQVFDLNAVVAGMGTMLERLISEDIRLAIRSSESPTLVKADRGQIEQVILNLAVNARDAMPHGGHLTIETAHVEMGERPVATGGRRAGAYALLSVTDTGQGMDAAIQARIFEPFFTTKELGKGTGLGLSTVYGIVTQCGGSITVESERGRGATFKVYLPRVAEEARKPDSDREAAAVPGGAETILVVEDDADVLALTRRVLREHGYAVLEAGNGSEALRVCEEHAGPIHLVISDTVMPGMSGPALTDRLAGLRPGIRSLLMSGHVGDVPLPRGMGEPGADFLQKPITPEALLAAVRKALAGPGA